MNYSPPLYLFTNTADFWSVPRSAVFGGTTVPHECYNFHNVGKLETLFYEDLLIEYLRERYNKS